MNQAMNLKPQSGEALEKALREIYDLFESLALRPLLLHETARSVKAGQITGDKLTIGIKALELTRNNRSIIFTRLRKYFDRGISKTLTFEPDFEHVISYDFAGVPIEIKVIERKYSFFKHPDMIIYKLDEYLLPNPIARYLKAQYIVQ